MRGPSDTLQISLCMVVRDEASFVGDTIASAAPVVDEVIVVDTGSVDGTPELAQAAATTMPVRILR